MSKEERDQLITDNMQLVYFLISKYFPDYIQNEDVQQEGMLGLIKAADTFNSSKGKFSTYASTCILNTIRHYFSRENKHTGCLSLEKTILTDEAGNDLTILDTIVGDEDVNTSRVDLKLLYDALKEPEKKVMELLSLSYSERAIAKELGVSHTHVQKIRRRILRKLRTLNGDNIN